MKPQLIYRTKNMKCMRYYKCELMIKIGQFDLGIVQKDQVKHAEIHSKKNDR